MATEYNIVDKKGAWFSYKGQRLGQGREAVREELKNNPKLLDELEEQVLIAHKESFQKNASKPSIIDDLSLTEEFAEV
jgi:recombination protein RecA